ncbi:MAG: hypothetical protein GX892_07545 [Thermoanaerobacteraceae bacterium]|nr:hypothetical protein [Thermoanaerobacteraceae bacterium]
MLRSVFDFLMNPTFSDSMMEFFSRFGDWGIAAMVIIKMVIILFGCLIIAIPFIPIIVLVWRKFSSYYIDTYEQEESSQIKDNVVDIKVRDSHKLNKSVS